MKDGGCAFPLSRETDGWYEAGMSLRDYFAGQIITGWIARYGPADVKEAAKRAYQIADAMIEAREADG